MRDADLVRALWSYAKRNPAVNWQENKMLKEAATRLQELTEKEERDAAENQGKHPAGAEDPR